MTVSEPQQPPLDIPHGLNRAIEYTRRVMFSPIQFGTWLNVGLMAFMAALCSAGSSGFGSLNGFSGVNGGSMPPNAPSTFEVRHVQAKILEQKAWLLQNESFAITIALCVLVTLGIVSLLLLWVSSRGQMMLIRSVAQRDFRIGENWSAVARPARSLMLFRLAFSLVVLLAFAAVFFMSVSMMWTRVQQGGNDPAEYFRLVIPALKLGTLVVLCSMIVDSLLHGLVTPLMYHLDISCLSAWGRLGTIARGNIWRILLFVVIRMACAVGVGMAGALVGCLTCCIGWMPVVSQVIFAFFYVFDRAFALYVLETLGPDYQIILPDPGDAPLAPPPLPLSPPPGIS